MPHLALVNQIRDDTRESSVAQITGVALLTVNHNPRPNSFIEAHDLSEAANHHTNVLQSSLVAEACALERPTFDHELYDEIISELNNLSDQESPSPEHKVSEVVTPVTIIRIWFGEDPLCASHYTVLKCDAVTNPNSLHILMVSDVGQVNMELVKALGLKLEVLQMTNVDDAAKLFPKVKDLTKFRTYYDEASKDKRWSSLWNLLFYEARPKHTAVVPFDRLITDQIDLSDVATRRVPITDCFICPGMNSLKKQFYIDLLFCGYAKVFGPIQREMQWTAIKMAPSLVDAKQETWDKILRKPLKLGLSSVPVTAFFCYASSRKLVHKQQLKLLKNNEKLMTSRDYISD